MRNMRSINARSNVRRSVLKDTGMEFSRQDLIYFNIILRCSKECYKDCGKCSYKVLKTIPNCRHEQMVKCGENEENVLCQFLVPVILPCGHGNKVMCHLQHSDLTHIECKRKCKTKLDCGHECSGDCHSCSGVSFIKYISLLY